MRRGSRRFRERFRAWLARWLHNRTGNQQPVPFMITSEIPTTTISAAAPATTPASEEHGFSFHDFLSAINPLQYLPVVGTIYRAVTGDVIPEALRRVGSFVVSGLMGGPVGLLINAAATVAEKVTDIDPEKILAAHFAPSPAAAGSRSEANSAGAAASASTAPPVAAAAPVPEQVALTPRQLAAYGVRSDQSGNLKLGDLEGADVLNSIQLIRLGKTAAAAYTANQPQAKFTMEASSG